MAMVADARAFGSNPKRTMLIEHQITLADCVAIFLLLALIFTVLILLVFHIGNRQI
jgi:energy-coupling factor transporter transmembrane protein EcfT